MDRYENEIDGEDLGLLLYREGTVCDDYFNNTAADAICKTMNYTSAVNWTTDEDFGSLQRNYGITLDNVRCSSTEWESCTFTERDDCEHDQDIFLSCREFFFSESGKALHVVLRILTIKKDRTVIEYRVSV